MLIVPIIMTVIIVVVGRYMYLPDEITWTGVIVCWSTYILTAIFDVFGHNLGLW